MTYKENSRALKELKKKRKLSNFLGQLQDTTEWKTEYLQFK